jgi:anion-transporting  ArsA/GET3 family ATPase
MTLGPLDQRLLVVVGAGGVGKTTLAAALGLQSARAGRNTLVMTFDPSLRLKDALGVGDEARERAVRVKSGTKGRLDVALLDARSTFDRLIRRYAPDDAAAERIFSNRFYRDLAGNLAGILEYMAVERLFEVSADGNYDRIILDTPPTRQALDFLEAPDRIVNFLDSGAVRIALKPWWEKGGGLKRMPMRIAAKGVEQIIVSGSFTTWSSSSAPSAPCMAASASGRTRSARCSEPLIHCSCLSPARGRTASPIRSSSRGS